ncbi:MAG: amylo-alpha-1,6-glucosidase [Verrucomicrobiales bacterium]
MSELTASPAPGQCVLKFVGDRIAFTLQGVPEGGTAFLRTTLGRAFCLQEEIIYQQRVRVAAHFDKRPEVPKPGHPRGLCWRDVPMQFQEGLWRVEMTVAEVGFFNAKPFYIHPDGRQIWPEGPDVGITVHPDECRSANTIYCAFVRMFGDSKTAISTLSEMDPHLNRLDKLGYTVIPPSGKFRDLIKELPHIVETLGCKILHLLPVNPTPATYARFGRYGSPYAIQDLTAIDPALVEFDRRTTGVDQFKELVHETHVRGAKLFLDMVINHTGWGSTLQEEHPEWFMKHENGVFESPGAWGTVWEDLVELDHRIPLSWDHLAEAFLTWCERGVDGFRCDAGYKVPTKGWQYIIAKVRQQYPNTCFLLEGLGGSWAATDELLTVGGMQWAYSELFQNYDGAQVSGYLDHVLPKCSQMGTFVHYSETHDNLRLAEKGKTWSLMRNQLCALTSPCGGYGFTCGVEWLAPEKVNVHSSRGMAWGNPDNLVAELGRLNKLISDHPAFFDGAKLNRISSPGSPVYMLERISQEGADKVWVVINLDETQPNRVAIDAAAFEEAGSPRINLLNPDHPVSFKKSGKQLELTLRPGEGLCLAGALVPHGLHSEEYRLIRSQAAFAVQALASRLEPEDFGAFDWKELAKLLVSDPQKFIGSIDRIELSSARKNLLLAVQTAMAKSGFDQALLWTQVDARRIAPVAPHHWLLIQDDLPFRAELTGEAKEEAEIFQSVRLGSHWFAAVPPVEARTRKARRGIRSLRIERLAPEGENLIAKVHYLSEEPRFVPHLSMPLHPRGGGLNAPVALLTNGAGAMARICVDIGSVKSKYDCLLGANLHPTVPVDRHVFVKRARIWANANGFITALDGSNIVDFVAGPPASWLFFAPAGDGQSARIRMTAEMPSRENSVRLGFEFLGWSHPDMRMERDSGVRLTIRLDIEDRNFHSETKRNSGADFHFSSNTHPLKEAVGFEFKPAQDRQLRATASAGRYHNQAEWSHNIPHALEQSRGQTGEGDAYSPGWFDLPLKSGEAQQLLITAEPNKQSEVSGETGSKAAFQADTVVNSALSADDSFGRQLENAVRAYVVRRDDFKTVIAGYPWFLDWGRDSLICARGLIAAGMTDAVEQLLIAFGRFEKNGTLPNTIHGEDASNRDTSDAPLWYGVVVEELASILGEKVYQIKVDPSGRSVADVLRGIVIGYVRGTPNGIQMDRDSALVWSPRHFTWMDTNYPAGTPREGYPVEIQALWIRLLRQLDRINAPQTVGGWKELGEKASESFLRLFWIKDLNRLSDCLLCRPGAPASEAIVDDALRSNSLFAVTLGLLQGEAAQGCVIDALKYLVIPGALRSLAPLPVRNPLPIHSSDWRLLNNPLEPYIGQYSGDEDTLRKPAYHNGTAWTWTFPSFCEAMAMAWSNDPKAVAAAKSYLGSTEPLLAEGCIGHLPEVLDGDAPHQQRGCDAQAWGATEALRVWKKLNYNA